MKNQRLNIELFKKIRDRIAEIPEAYDQSVYCRRDDRAPCGTAACLAGEAIICSAPTVGEGVEHLRHYDRRDLIPETAAILLGLPRPMWGYGQPPRYNETARLFACHADNVVFWPEPFASQFQAALNATERAAVAVAYLDHIIETGKVLE
jgi:hypothetical protein